MKQPRKQIRATRSAEFTPAEELLRSDFSIDTLDRRQEIKRMTDDVLQSSIPRIPYFDRFREEITAALFPGRRLRPTLFLLLTSPGKVPDLEEQEDLWTLAAALELCHRASLVLDDYLDDDIERRGKPTHHVLYGPDSSILISHQLIALAYDLLGQLPKRWEPQFTRTYADMCVGERSDIFNLSPAHDYVSLYSDITLLKTSALFALLAELVADARELPSKASAHLRRTGRLLGELYQVYNDIYDDLFSKPTERGEKDEFHLRLTLMGAIVLDSGSRSEQELFKRAASGTISLQEFQLVRSVLRQDRFVSQARALCEKKVVDFERAISLLSEDSLVEPLRGLALWIQQRNCWDQAIRRRAGY